MENRSLTVEAVEYLDAEADVFDLEVEVDHSFLVLGAVVHNSDRCRALAGQRFTHGRGPVPPQHPQCRSSIASLPPGVSSFGDTRFGPWLKRQPAAYQRDVLGPRRYERFRDGIDTADSYVRDGRYLSLEQLRARDAELFRKAGA